MILVPRAQIQTGKNMLTVLRQKSGFLRSSCSKIGRKIPVLKQCPVAGIGFLVRPAVAKMLRSAEQMITGTNLVYRN